MQKKSMITGNRFKLMLILILELFSSILKMRMNRKLSS
jgi:hypothetical protein